jgi:Iap family predicted aminopeptidase
MRPLQYLWVAWLLLVTNAGLQAQIIPDSILAVKARTYISFLAADSLKGRGNYTAELRTAATYIKTHFDTSGLLPLHGYQDILVPIDNQRASENELVNVVGVLPGKTLPDEVILFSAHYDHLIPGDSKKDSIFNGANDNASGVAALMLLVDFYARQHNNQRTLIFCAFAGEELGLLGSQDLVKKLKTHKIVSQINIDMVGISQYRRKGFLLTGATRSELFRHFTKALKPMKFRVYGDYNEERNLFGRSDNYPFALAGVPAHTIMTADDNSLCYHQECDEIKNVDVENVAITVQAIISAAAALVNGSFTPKRISVYR